MKKLLAGDKLPDVKLTDQNGSTVSLKRLKGSRVLIYFYPKANTPGCTTQSCTVRDALSELDALEIKAIGISPDKPELQKKFDDKYNLGFPLLSDPDHSAAEAFGAWGEKSMYGRKYMGIIRSAFLADKKGIITNIWYKVSPKDTVPNVLKACKEQH